MKRSPIRRRRGVTAPVTPEVREQVFRRDGMCLLARMDPTHGCRDRWGDPHSPYDFSKLTPEHVKQDLRAGVRAYVEIGGQKVAHPAILVTLCAYSNIAVPSKTQRDMFRVHLAEHHPEFWGAFIERREAAGA